MNITRILIYKRTHIGDPHPATGEFGSSAGEKSNGCMGRVRSWRYDAVIGVGGIRPDQGSERIKEKLTWIGIEPLKKGDPKLPLVTFRKFRCLNERGPDFRTLAPNLAARLFDGGARFRLIDAGSGNEWSEALEVLKLAAKAPSSGRGSTTAASQSNGCSKAKKKPDCG
jgi:hypothetical protein